MMRVNQMRRRGEDRRGGEADQEDNKTGRKGKEKIKKMKGEESKRGRRGEGEMRGEEEKIRKRGKQRTENMMRSGRSEGR